VIKNSLPVRTAGRASGAFVVASLNLLTVASVRGAMIATGSGVTLPAHIRASRSSSES